MTTQLERFYNRMQNALAFCLKRSPASVNLEQLTTLVADFEPFSKQEGNNDNWKEYYEGYRQNCWIPCLKLKDMQTDRKMEVFADQLYQVQAMAWACQLLATPDGDEHLELIWEECGAIAQQLLPQ